MAWTYPHVQHHGGWTLYELADLGSEGLAEAPAAADGRWPRNCALFSALCQFAGSRAGRTADLALAAARAQLGVPGTATR